MHDLPFQIISTKYDWGSAFFPLLKAEYCCSTLLDNIHREYKETGIKLEGEPNPLQRKSSMQQRVRRGFSYWMHTRQSSFTTVTTVLSELGGRRGKKELWLLIWDRLTQIKPEEEVIKKIDTIILYVVYSSVCVFVDRTRLSRRRNPRWDSGQIQQHRQNTCSASPTWLHGDGLRHRLHTHTHTHTRGDKKTSRLSTKWRENE